MVGAGDLHIPSGLTIKAQHLHPGQERAEAVETDPFWRMVVDHPGVTDPVTGGAAAMLRLDCDLDEYGISHPAFGYTIYSVSREKALLGMGSQRVR